MTPPLSAAPRKPRRLGLYGPFLVLLAFALAWSAGWLWLRAETLRRLDGARTSMIGTGRNLSWASRAVTGFPFRLDVNLTNLRLREPSGWGLAFPTLNAEALVFAPTRWVAVAPDGAAFTRPAGGQVIVGAKVLRASVSKLNAHPPRISVEGIGLTFTAAPGAEPFFVSAAQALVMEILLTAGLVNTVLGTASGARNIGTNGAIAVGGYVALAGLWAGSRREGRSAWRSTPSTPTPPP